MNKFIFFIILFLIYDAYMRQRDRAVYATKAELEAWKKENTMKSSASDITSLDARLRAIETSAFA